MTPFFSTSTDWPVTWLSGSSPAIGKRRLRSRWMENARGHLTLHQALAARGQWPAVAAVRHFGEFDYVAGSLAQALRVVVKAEVLAGNEVAPAKNNQRYAVTTLRIPAPQTLYQQYHWPRSQAENQIKQVKVDVKSVGNSYNF